MDVVQCFSHLPDIGENGCKWHSRAYQVALAQGATRGIVHNEKGDTIFYGEIVDTDNMGMDETSKRTCLSVELLFLLTRELGMQDFDGCLGVEVQVLPQVDFSD
jgi:hypothetical protein